MITPKQKTLGAAIRDLRIQKGMKQIIFAKKVGITQTAISQMETNKMTPSINTIVKVAKVLNTTPTKIIQLTIDSKRYSDIIDFIFKTFKR